MVSLPGNGFVRLKGDAGLGEEGGASIAIFVAAVYDRRIYFGPAVTDRRYRKLRAVITDREGGANIHGALSGGGFLVVLGLLVKINVGLVVVVFQKIRSFIETDTAGRAGVIDVPGAFDIFGQFVRFIGHGEFLPEKAWAPQCLSRGTLPSIKERRFEIADE